MGEMDAKKCHRLRKFFDGCLNGGLDSLCSHCNQTVGAHRDELCRVDPSTIGRSFHTCARCGRPASEHAQRASTLNEELAAIIERITGLENRCERLEREVDCGDGQCRFRIDDSPVCYKCYVAGATADYASYCKALGDPEDGPVGGPDMAEHITKLRTAATLAREVLVECRAVLKLADEAPKAFDTAQANVTFARIHKALELLDALS